MIVNISTLPSIGSAFAFLFFAIAGFGQDLPRVHEPSVKEREVLDKSGRLPMFNWPGPSLRQGLFNSVQSEFGRIGAGSVTGNLQAEPMRDENQLQQASCTADIVVVGTVTGQTSALSSNESVVVTLYNFVARKILKGSTSDGIQTLNVLRPGGFFATPQGTIKQHDIHIPEFALGASYILFLKRIADVDGFVSTNPDLTLSVPTDNKHGLTSLNGAPARLEFDSLSVFEQALKRGLDTCAAVRGGRSE